jgi:hypothetical protein
MADMHEGELEMELEEEFHEGELENEGESSLEGEGWLGAIGNVVGSLLGEGEEELEGESSFEGEGELEEELENEGESSLEGEGWLGAIGNVVGSLLGEGEEEDGLSSFGQLVKRAARLVQTAVGGHPDATVDLPSDRQYEEEWEGETEGESEEEVVQEVAAHPLTHNEAVAEMMAEAASQESHEGEAEAMAGAATVTVISPSDRRALRQILPYLVRGTAILTRILRRRRATRPMVRAVPTIVRRTVKNLKRQAARGIPITRKRAARTAAKQVRRVLSNPKACAVAIKRNVKVSRAYKRPRRRLRTSSRRRRSAVR